MQPDQSIFEMVEEVLVRQAKYLADQTGQSFERALEVVADTAAGQQLRELANGEHCHEKARDWQASMLRDRAEERLMHLGEGMRVHAFSAPGLARLSPNGSGGDPSEAIDPFWEVLVRRRWLATMQDGKKARRPHWLIVKDRISGMDVLTVDLGGEEALAVFAFEEEAQMFLELRPTASGEGWRARRTSAGELVSVLYGPCSGAQRVALDPLPGVLDRGKSIGLLAIDRNGFLRMLLGEGPSSLHLLPSRTLGPHKRVGHGNVA